MSENNKEDFMAEVEQAEKEEISKYHTCMDEIRIIKGDEFLDSLKKYIQESNDNYDFQFVTRKPDWPPEGEYIQGEDGEIWVDQYQNGGYSGDSFAGYVYVRIQPGMYLKFHYSM